MKKKKIKKLIEIIIYITNKSEKRKEKYWWNYKKDEKGENEKRIRKIKLK